MRYAPTSQAPHAAHRARIQARSGLPRLGLRRASCLTKRTVCLKQSAGSSVCLTASTVKIAATLPSSATASSSAEINSAPTGKFPVTGKSRGSNSPEGKRFYLSIAKNFPIDRDLSGFCVSLSGHRASASVNRRQSSTIVYQSAGAAR